MNKDVADKSLPRIGKKIKAVRYWFLIQSM